MDDTQGDERARWTASEKAGVEGLRGLEGPKTGKEGGGEANATTLTRARNQLSVSEASWRHSGSTRPALASEVSMVGEGSVSLEADAETLAVDWQATKMCPARWDPGPKKSPACKASVCDAVI